MKYQCDTAKECPYDRYSAYRPRPRGPVCGGCNPIGEPRETHTCYFCDHTGQDVNRIAVVMPPKEYCCDDGIMCDERWQALDQGDSLEEQIESIIVEEILNEAPNWNVPPLLTLSGNAGSRATARIMKLIELPF